MSNTCKENCDTIETHLFPKETTSPIRRNWLNGITSRANTNRHHAGTTRVRVESHRRNRRYEKACEMWRASFSIRVSWNLEAWHSMAMCARISSRSPSTPFTRDRFTGRPRLTFQWKRVSVFRFQRLFLGAQKLLAEREEPRLHQHPCPSVHRKERLSVCSGRQGYWQYRWSINSKNKLHWAELLPI